MGFVVVKKNEGGLVKFNIFEFEKILPTLIDTFAVVTSIYITYLLLSLLKENVDLSILLCVQRNIICPCLMLPSVLVDNHLIAMH